jgi:hypothetical protein
MGLCAALVGDLHSFERRALPAGTLAELTMQLVVIHYGALLHPALRNSRGEWRELVLAGLMQCDAATEELQPDELCDGTAINW